MAVQTIACKNGNIFAACREEESNDFEWLAEVGYYAQQGCIIEKKEEGTWNFNRCECEHCNSLEHNAPKLDDED